MFWSSQGENWQQTVLVEKVCRSPHCAYLSLKQ